MADPGHPGGGGERRYDGVSAAHLAAECGVPRLCLYEVVTSTMDVAHELGADGAPSGTTVLADEQAEGRGRMGRAWRSDAGRGVWLTVVERIDAAEILRLLSLRVGLHVARALDECAGETVGLKWPNDLWLRGGKVGGVLIESRWQSEVLQWVAIGVGLNVRRPAGEVAGAAGLPPGTSRVHVLRRIVPAIRAAVRATGPLSEHEVADYARRDRARGRRCIEPAAGRVSGIAADGALLIETATGIVSVNAGSLVFDDEPAGGSP